MNRIRRKKALSVCIPGIGLYGKDNTLRPLLFAAPAGDAENGR
jgi:hypothetical protein